MYCVSYYGDIIKAYGDKLNYLQSLGWFITSDKIEAIRYSKAVLQR